MCIQSTLFRQKDGEGERLVVHLFNGINSATDHGLPEANVPLREEAVPVAGIRVRFHKFAAKRIHLEPEGIDLKPEVIDVKRVVFRDSGNWIEVRLPPLSVHAMVVAELEKR
jgi:hypothetical protein